ncbi:GTP cyclohydrolase 1 type 2 [Vallitalea longa]|uniref:GTP cyclohydrolase 1 type 2 homolog n=1 Tax=Vallitalea longa TaxID=2936439 RepID=A0A9W5YBP2_9FIRM|nr:Nif3-like dinuclear metal center hexameric protein [Vallitalea longa]GKX31045.1 GTP cyclohydrolase 1 type 2 [Vallitalea longa]
MSVKCIEIINKLKELAPPKLAENWDNVGLLVGDSDAEINRILISLDATKEVVDEAVDKKVDMILTHHPIIFKGVKNINTSSVIGRKIIKLIKNDICVYSAHTNLDAANEGLSAYLANRLQLEASNILVPTNNFDVLEQCGTGRIGYIEEMTLNELCVFIKEKLNLERIRVIGDLDRKVKKVAVSPGSSMEFSETAYKNGAEVYITGDIKYHDAQEFKEKGMALIDAGHFGTENIVLDMFHEYLEKYFKNQLEIITSTVNKDPFVIK